MSSNVVFRKAERRKAKLRCALAGPSGSGKTYSALLMAFGLGGRVALIDTENGSGELYAHLGEYDVCRLTSPFTPDKYVEAIRSAEASGYDVIIVDSLSHAWAGEGGVLDMQGKIADSGKGNSYTAWRTVTPKHNALVEAMLQSKAHIIATVRSKQEYVQQKDEKTGKTEIKKVGMAPVQREGLEYEFSVFFDLSHDHVAVASKDRTSLFDGRYIKPTPELGKELLAWLNTGADAPAHAQASPPPPPPPPAAAAPGPPPQAPPAPAATPPTAAAPADPAPKADPPPPAPPAAEAFPGRPTDAQKKKLFACFNELGIKDRDTRLSWVRQCLGRQNITSQNDIDKDEAAKVIDWLESAIRERAQQKWSA